MVNIRSYLSGVVRRKENMNDYDGGDKFENPNTSSQSSNIPVPKSNGQSEKKIEQTMGYADAIVTSKVITKRGRPKKVKEAQGSDISNDNATERSISHQNDNNSMAGGI